MQAWFGFYAVIGGASATLLGLLFVAVSINAAVTLGAGHGGSKRLAEQAFQNYLAVMMVSLLAFFPGMKTSTFGLAAICLTAVWAIWVLVRLYCEFARPTDDEYRVFALRRHLSSLIGFGILVATALRMAMNIADDRNLLAGATIILLFSATQTSWELLNRIAQTKHAQSSN
jgi:lysylphosphatidylglycerol synthetase-like protein (DUF2156 family)